ncbi:MAG: rod shape-determining protein RodA [Deltaproteobacteria bacterium]|nr:rod shape-determining protein RodA [Deltaproteobacteria bacterium]
MIRIWKKLNLDKADWPFFLTVLAICVIGLFNLYSATFDLSISRYFYNQLLWMSGGVVIGMFLALVHYHFYIRTGYFWYVGTVSLLLFVLFFGKSAGGSQRWIHLGFFNLQPSELAKIAVVLGLATYFHGHHQKRKMNLVDLIVPMIILVIPCILIVKQPDLGTTLVVFFTGCMMIWFVGVQRKILILVVTLGLVSVPLAWKFALKPYQKDRVISFLEPEKYADSKGYQIIQSKIAVGSGKVLGKGYLKGSQSKLQFLPKQHTDFVFSNYAEEFGFMGSLVLLGLYFLIGLLGLNIAMTSKDVFGITAAFGLTSTILIQTMINLGMELGLLPVVGMTLPFFSYGGTSLLTSFIALGILMNISIHRLTHASKKG